MTLPGWTQLVGQATPQFPRHSEGDLIALRDGRLLLVWGRKTGAEDWDKGELVAAISGDEGQCWSEPAVIQRVWGDVTDVMSVSLLRTSRGLHLFFIGRGPEKLQDTRLYQMMSQDEGHSWSPPVSIVLRRAYHVLNNARVIQLSAGRLVVPIAFCDDIRAEFQRQRVCCLLSDDLGQSWRESAILALPDAALMEPGVAQCADGSLYMTIRTALGALYEARSFDDGETWSPPQPTTLVSPAAPSTVVRASHSNDLWMFWCCNPAGAAAGWADRTPQAFAVSHDNGATWSVPKVWEDDPTKGFGYISVDVIQKSVHLTYYDWDKSQPNFYMCQLRHRVIPLAWFDDLPS